MSFSKPVIKRRDRRKLGRGQQSPATVAGVVVSSTGTTNVTLTFSVPVVVRGLLTNTVATRTLVSQTVVSPTVVTQVWSGTVATFAYAVPANMPNVNSRLGGGNAGVAGIFP